MLKELFTKKYRLLLIALIIVVLIAIIVSIMAIVIAVKDKRYKAEFKQNVAIVKAEFYENESLYNGLVATVKKVEFGDGDYYIGYEGPFTKTGAFIIRYDGYKSLNVDLDIIAEMQSLYDEIAAKTSNGVNGIYIHPTQGRITVDGAWYDTGYYWQWPWIKPNNPTGYSSVAFTYFDAMTEKGYVSGSYLETLNDNWVMHTYRGLK